jgi:hypothetical protein
LVGVEALLRLYSPDQRGLRDVYLSSPPDGAPARQWEIGVRPEASPAQEGETVVPESPGLLAYVCPVPEPTHVIA